MTKINRCNICFAIIENDGACKGLIFKLRKNSYWCYDRIVFRQEFYLMKTLSCNKCARCEYIKDQLKIDIGEHNDPWLSNNEMNQGNLFEAFLYSDYESGLRPFKSIECGKCCCNKG